MTIQLIEWFVFSCVFLEVNATKLYAKVSDFICSNVEKFCCTSKKNGTLGE